PERTPSDSSARPILAPGSSSGRRRRAGLGQRSGAPISSSRVSARAEASARGCWRGRSAPARACPELCVAAASMRIHDDAPHGRNRALYLGREKPPVRRLPACAQLHLDANFCTLLPLGEFLLR